MTERRPDDDDDGRAAGNRSQTRPVPDAGSFPPRSTFGTEDPLRAEQAGAAAPPRPAPGAKPAGIWGQTIALGAAVPPAQHPHAAPPGPAPGPAEPEAPVVQRAVVVMPAVQAGQPPRAAARGPGQGTPPPAPQADRGQRQPPARFAGTDSDRPAPDATHAAEPLRVPSQRPAPAPFKTSQRGAAAKGTLLMSGLGADSRPAGATPVAAAPAAARPPAAQTVPLGGDGKLARTTPPAASPAGPAATRQLRPGAARARAEAPEAEPAERVPPHGDLSFAATMPSVPPSAIPPQASAPSPPRTPAPARPAQPGRDQIHLQLDDADFVQRAPSSIPAGVPRQNPMLIVGGGLVLVLLVVIGWFLMREPAAPPATAPTAEPNVAPVAPVTPTPSEATAPAAVPTAVGGAAATATPSPAPGAVQPEPAPSTPKAAAVPAAEPTAPKAAARRPSKGGKSKAAPSDDVSSARDALRALEREPILKVKPSREESDEEPVQLGPADAPTMAPPAPGE